jgi:hypothetical protein
MARFPFEEDYRHRFGEFEEWRGCYIFIGRHPCVDPYQPAKATIRQPIPRRVHARHVTAAAPAKQHAPARPRRQQG